MDHSHQSAELSLISALLEQLLKQHEASERSVESKNGGEGSKVSLDAHVGTCSPLLSVKDIQGRVVFAVRKLREKRYSNGYINPIKSSLETVSGDRSVGRSSEDSRWRGVETVDETIGQWRGGERLVPRMGG